MTLPPKRDPMAKPLIALPQDEQDALKALHADKDTKLPELRQRVLALRHARWPLRAIGDPVGAPRSTVRMWELEANSEADLPVVPECERAARARGERVVRMRPDVPPEDRDELRRLAASAKKVRSRTPETDPAKKDARALDALIETYIARNIPISKIADRMGVTPRAVTARHERFVERKNANADNNS